MFRQTFLVLALIASFPLVASATPTITVGNHQLLPNTPNQTIEIQVSGDASDAFIGVDLYLYVADGSSGPVITNVDIVGAGTVFAGNNFGMSDYGAPWQAPGREVAAITTTQNGAINPNGVLAFVTFDTTGIALGDYSLSLSHPLLGESDLPPFSAGVTILSDGVLSVVPEPSSVVLGLFAAAGLGSVAVRRRRQLSL